jgi:hypothetical protein
VRGTIRSHGVLIGPKNNHRDQLNRRMGEMELALKEVDEEMRVGWQKWMRQSQAALAQEDRKPN